MNAYDDDAEATWPPLSAIRREEMRAFAAFPSPEKWIIYAEDVLILLAELERIEAAAPQEPHA